MSKNLDIESVDTMALPSHLRWPVVVVGGPEHHEEITETLWLQNALAGTSLDLIIVLGVITVVTGLLGTPEPGASLVMADVVARYLILSRREA